MNGQTATAIVSVAGEELGLALLINYLATQGTEARVVGDRCTPGMKRVFSMSNYLRRCAGDQVLLQMPVTCSRLRWLSTLFPPAGYDDGACLTTASKRTAPDHTRARAKGL